MEEKRIQDYEVEKSKGRKWLAVLLGVLIFVASVLLFFQAGCWYTAATWEDWYPDYEKADIRLILDKVELTEEDYETLYRQTGLTKLAVDDMRNNVGGKERILDIQTAMFSDNQMKSRRFAPFTYMDELVSTRAVVCDAQDGDIIVSATTRVSWWRYGHTAIVVDGKNGIIAECASPGSVSDTASIKVYRDFANFLVLRPKVDVAVKKEIVEYIKSDMMGIKYNLTVGLFSKKFPEEITSTQCAHFVWYAYKKFGVDLDSNGGWLIKGQDIALSDKVELVQAFGFDLDTLWS